MQTPQSIIHVHLMSKYISRARLGSVRAKLLTPFRKKWRHAVGPLITDTGLVTFALGICVHTRVWTQTCFSFTQESRYISLHSAYLQPRLPVVMNLVLQTVIRGDRAEGGATDRCGRKPYLRHDLRVNSTDNSLKTKYPCDSVLPVVGTCIDLGLIINIEFEQISGLTKIHAYPSLKASPSSLVHVQCRHMPTQYNYLQLGFFW